MSEGQLPIVIFQQSIIRLGRLYSIGVRIVEILMCAAVAADRRHGFPITAIAAFRRLCGALGTTVPLAVSEINILHIDKFVIVLAAVFVCPGFVTS